MRCATIALLGLLAAPAYANHATMQGDPYPEGDGVLMSITGCDTLPQAQAAIAAWVDGGFEGFDAYMRGPGAVRNAMNEPICGNLAMPMAAISTHASAEVEYHGETMTIYIVEFFLTNGVTIYAITPRPSVPPGQGI